MDTRVYDLRLGDVVAGKPFDRDRTVEAIEDMGGEPTSIFVDFSDCSHEEWDWNRVVMVRERDRRTP